MGYIESGKKDGATLYQGGDRHGSEGYFINPTIFTDVKPDMKIVREEIFGPVGVVIKFEDEAGKKIFLVLFGTRSSRAHSLNNSQMWSNKLTTLVWFPLAFFVRFWPLMFIFGNGIVYGLAAAVFTQNLNRAIETAHKLQAGTAWVSSFLLYLSFSRKKTNKSEIKLFTFFFFLQDQLCQPLKRTSSFRWIQTIWYRTWNGRICSRQVRFFPPTLLPTNWSSFTHYLPCGLFIYLF